MVYNTDDKLPLIVVVTVTLNHSEELEETIQSVLAQTYPYIEHIVVDGGSEDESVSILKKYSEKIKTWVSESDKGIYDAMNKGVDLGTGEWVIFMNSGDCFADDHVVNNIFTLPFKEVDFIYGHHMVLYENAFEGIKRAGETYDLWKGMVFSHQAVFIKMDMLRKHPFCLAEPIGADYHMIFTAYAAKAIFLKCDVIIAKIRNNGLSDIQRVPSLISHWRVVRKHQKNFRVDAYYTTAVIIMIIRQFVKFILPRKMISRIIKYKYR